MVERCCAHAARFAEGLRAAGYEVVNDVELNQVLVSFGDDGLVPSFPDSDGMGRQPGQLRHRAYPVTTVISRLFVRQSRSPLLR